MKHIFKLKNIFFILLLSMFFVNSGYAQEDENDAPDPWGEWEEQADCWINGDCDTPPTPPNPDDTEPGKWWDEVWGDGALDLGCANCDTPDTEPDDPEPDDPEPDDCPDGYDDCGECGGSNHSGCITDPDPPCNITSCPTNYKLVNCNCVEKPKKKWKLDRDSDGWGQSQETGADEGSPGAGWVLGTVQGPDCDDSPTGGNVHKLNKCHKCKSEPADGKCYEDCPEKTNGGTKPNGKVIAVFYKGSPFGGGKDIDASKALGTGRRFNDLKKIVEEAGKEFKGEVIAPGYTASSGVDNGSSFIKENYHPGDQIIIYGYSWGGDLAVGLSEELGNVPVNLLVTVDASDGPLLGSTVDTSISDNVSTNLNIFQTTGSGVGSSSSEGGTSPGSHGGPNTAENSNKTKVVNKDVTADEVEHGNIQDAEATESLFKNQIKKHIIGCVNK